jgi:hypothetical protein
MTPTASKPGLPVVFEDARKAVFLLRGFGQPLQRRFEPQFVENRGAEIEGHRPDVAHGLEQEVPHLGQ